MHTSLYFHMVSNVHSAQSTIDRCDKNYYFAYSLLANQTDDSHSTLSLAAYLRPLYTPGSIPKYFVHVDLVFQQELLVHEILVYLDQTTGTFLYWWWLTATEKDLKGTVA